MDSRAKAAWYYQQNKIDILEGELKMQRELFEYRYEILLDALMNAPAMPEPKVLKILGRISSSHHSKGKKIQMEKDAPSIPFACEFECGAGFWDALTRGQWRDGKFSDCQRKIKMTKELPTEDGYYYWCSEDRQDIEIVEVERSMISTLYVDRGESGIWHIDELGGYWAKVEQDQFEFID